MASTSILIVINSPASAAIDFVPAQPSFTAPIAAGTVLGTLTITPAGWSGAVTLSGPDAAKLSVVSAAGVLQVKAAADLMTGTLTATATTAP